MAINIKCMFAKNVLIAEVLGAAMTCESMIDKFKILK